jgi:type III restriction enzyme
MGTRAFEDFVRLLETEGVGIKTVTTPPAPPVNVEPVLEKIAYDIAIPLTRPVYMHDYKRLSLFDPLALDPVYDQSELDEPMRIRLRMEFATTETEVHQADILSGPPPPAQELLASITNKVIRFARLPGGFAQLYPLTRTYIVQRCFGRAIDIDRAEIRAHLRFPLLQDGIARYLARKLGELTAEKRAIEFENAAFKLSDTTPFIWRRNLPLLACRKTVFNLVATYNDYEQAFARFLDRCPDVPRFAALGTTEQESGTRFRVDFLKPSGAIGFYHPDWVAVQQTAAGEVNWIVETKGRVWEDTLAKDAAIADWCQKVSEQTGAQWRYVRVNQADFGYGQFEGFHELLTVLIEEQQPHL